MKARHWLPGLTLMLAGVIASVAPGDEPATVPRPQQADGKPAEKPAPARPLAADRAQLERKARQFARKHHPELADLLDRLRASDRRAYRSAIADLNRDRERLERIRTRAPDRHSFELEMWKLGSRIRLLAAQAAMGDRDALRPQLRAMIAERQRLRLNRLREDRDRLTARLERMKQTIEELESRPDSALDKAVEQIIDGARSRADKGQPDARRTLPAESASTGESGSGNTSQPQSGTPKD